jgi:hypothetical protein
MTPISLGGSGPDRAKVKKTATTTAAAKMTRPEWASRPVPASVLAELAGLAGAVAGALCDARVLPALIVELHEALRRLEEQGRRQVAGMLVQSYRAADAIADKLGLVDLSARIIGMMATMALESGDETLLATTAYVRSELFFASGAHDDGRRMLVRAADRLDPGTGVTASAAYGSLHMRAAVFAARDANLVDAQARQLSTSPACRPISGREQHSSVGTRCRKPHRKRGPASGRSGGSGAGSPAPRPC